MAFRVSETICFMIIYIALYIAFQSSVEHLDMAHKTCLISVWGAVPPSVLIVRFCFVLRLSAYAVTILFTSCRN